MFTITNIKHRRCKHMKKVAYNIMPSTEEVLRTMGEQIKLARLRHDLSAELVAERAGISRSSPWKVESGNPAVAMGIYAVVLHALNDMDKDLLLVAKDDILGREMQELNLVTGKCATRRKK
jgi:transcriptional regulator with XRE-family HTH domain